MLQWKRQPTLILFLILLIGMLYLNLRMVAPYLLAIAMGVVLALLMNTPYRWLRNHNVGKKTAAGAMCVTLLLVILGPIAGFVTAATKQAIAAGQMLAESKFDFAGLFHKISHLAPVEKYIGDPAVVEAQFRGAIQSMGQTGTAMLVAIASGVPGLVLQLVLALIASFFMLTDGPKLLRYLQDKIPLEQDVRQSLYDSFQNTSIGVILATVAAALAQGAMLFVAYLVLGVPGAFLAAGATFVFAWIPVVGSSPVWIAGAVYLYFQQAYGPMAAMVVIGLLTGIVDNFVRPWVLRGRGEMHPFVALVTILGGVHLFGFVGLFFGPILASVLLSLLKTWPVVAGRLGLANPGLTTSTTTAADIITPTPEIIRSPSRIGTA